VEAAREILREAESKGKKSSKELSVRRGMIWKANLDKQNAELEEASADQARSQIEAALRKEEEREPSIERALAELVAARAEMDRELHRVVPTLPTHKGQPTGGDYAHEMGIVGETDQRRLEEDVRYQEAKRKTYKAAAELNRSRHAIYKKHPDWVEATSSATAARLCRVEAEKRIVLANAGTLHAAHTAHTAERAAKEARLVIARGRAMIRELGGVPPPPPPGPKAKHSSKSSSK
jgi:hypothetical protein